MQLKFPKEITIGSVRFKVIKEKSHNGGSFCFGDGEIRIGVDCIEKDPGYTFMIICHEVAEIIHIILGTRYDDPSVKANYKFFQDHKDFENHTRLFAQTIQQFMK